MYVCGFISDVCVNVIRVQILLLVVLKLEICMQWKLPKLRTRDSTFVLHEYCENLPQTALKDVNQKHIWERKKKCQPLVGRTPQPYWHNNVSNVTWPKLTIRALLASSDQRRAKGRLCKLPTTKKDNKPVSIIRKNDFYSPSNDYEWIRGEHFCNGKFCNILCTVSYRNLEISWGEATRKYLTCT